MRPLAQALEIVGGVKLLGKVGQDAMGIVQLVRRGMPTDSVQFVMDSGRLTLAEVDRIVLPRKTLADRARRGTLTPEQSDRLLRVARIIAIAEDTFADKDKAATWLRRPTSALDGEQPLTLLDTTEGARTVERLLGQIAHGIAA